ncbi:unnamed protein product [Prorocentrum cordatum]|uniref:PPM-type phosphatase domain-containing protein n=1 Tax=Prorocentrum cordatum TaxID=2364126 RepID=A0ABN9SMK3_9DINO|nr:unnamed protein product [Polarella glacialis]|mmetsp:Transcript_86764/g.226446  ORF Transcript_86764/g.226446 Transcript_86764/m.226446 type:complete len:536 (+) Transcript_86764:56-1663(+)
MGAILPRACDSTLIERQANKGFDVAVAEVNGWRTDMEDAHLIWLRDDVGVFGVYDGHGGKDCSAFAARMICKWLEEEGVPQDDAAWEKLFIEVDQAFLDSGMASGTTATMCVVHKPQNLGEKLKLHVINAGDSRTILGKANGCIFDGGGTDKGLTRDHKPEDPEERRRIVKAGGTVENDRVNGNLSVSRGFGDRDCKETGGPGPDNRPVTCIPEQYHFECDETDFVLLVCDGVSEGDFSNAEVVELVAEALNGGKDAGIAARYVCHKAIDRNSKDNITCMVVRLQGVSEAIERHVEFIPGSISKLTHAGFRKAYAFMAGKAKLSLAEAVAGRYEVLQAELKCEPSNSELTEEAKMLGTPCGAPGSDERLKWAEQWLEHHPEEAGGGGGPGGMDMEMLMNMLGKGGGKGGGPDIDMLRSILGKGKGKRSDVASSGGRGDSRTPEPEPRWFTTCCRRRDTPKVTSSRRAGEPPSRSISGPEVGDDVVVHGLAGAVELNGCRGRVLSFIEASDRFEVQLEGMEGTKALKASNLRVNQD